MYKSIFFFIGVLMTLSLQAQNSKIVETEFEVSGNCSMCQIRIENAALLAGVKKVDWDKETKMLHLIYREDKVDIMDVHKSIAGAGHDTSLLKADSKAYSKLPACCSYKDHSNTH